MNTTPPPASRLLWVNPKVVAVLALAFGCVVPEIRANAPFDSAHAGFEVRVKGETNPYRVLGLFVQPGQIVEFTIARPGRATFELVAPNDLAVRGDEWRWTAPLDPGLFQILIRRLEPASEMTFNVFVMVPFRNGVHSSLNGYRIGKYPSTALRGLDIYRPPKGLVEVLPEYLDISVAPHFTLGQFLCKQEGDFPKYLHLRERLLLKLEYLLGLVNESGYAASSFHIMSGFRTPSYNHAIGNVEYSRHLWGGAADIFVDESPRDGVMDDLNGDGKSDIDDSLWLYELIDGKLRSPEYEPYVGGLGLYGPNHVHGPFVHVDARGFRARWGR